MKQMVLENPQRSIFFNEFCRIFLKALIQLEYLACGASWLVFVNAILMDHENGDNIGQPSDMVPTKHAF